MSPPPPPPSLTQGFAFGPRDFMQNLGSNATVIDASGLPETLPWLLRVPGRPPSSPHTDRPVLHTVSITHHQPHDTLHGVGRWATYGGTFSRPFDGLLYAYHHGRLRFLWVPEMSCFDILCQRSLCGVGFSDTLHRVHCPPPFIPPPRFPPWLYKAHFLLGFASTLDINYSNHLCPSAASYVHPGFPSHPSLTPSFTMPTSHKLYRAAA